MREVLNFDGALEPNSALPARTDVLGGLQDLEKF
jgi:hypothetical protein